MSDLRLIGSTTKPGSTDLTDDENILSYFKTTVSADFFRLVCGEVLGRGIARTVYECDLVPDCVVKIETQGGSFQNVLEWDFWQYWSMDKRVTKWLAPCHSISPCGTILIQRRTTPTDRDRYPTKVPAFLTDKKWNNWGWMDGRLVCHDYALTRNTIGLQVRKAEWWGD